MNGILRYFLGGFCFQNPSHSLQGCHLCVRCLGIYTGIMLFYMKTLFFKSSSYLYIRVFFVGIVINLLQYILYISGLTPYNRFIVFILGLILGISAGGVIVYNLTLNDIKQKYLWDIALLTVGTLIGLFYFNIYSGQIVNFINSIIITVSVFLIFWGIFHAYSQRRKTRIFWTIISSIAFIFLTVWIMGTVVHKVHNFL